MMRANEGAALFIYFVAQALESVSSGVSIWRNSISGWSLIVCSIVAQGAAMVTGRNTPLASDVDLAALAEELDGYSAADCAALIREAALTAMRESLSAAEVTGAHLASARDAVRPSLDPAQLAALAAYAKSRER